MGLWSGKSGRGEVAPMAEGQDEYSPLNKPSQRQSPPPASVRRARPARGWLGFFLMLNIVAIAGFIFASAWYFPSTSTSGVVEQAIKQGDLSLLELPGRVDATTDAPIDNRDVDVSVAVDGHDQRTPNEQTPATEEVTPEAQTDPVVPERTRANTPIIRSEGGQDDKQDAVNHTSFGVVSSAPPAVEIATPIVSLDDLPATTSISHPPVEATVMKQTPADSLTPSVSVVRSQSMADLLRRMKGTPPPTTAATKGEVTTEVTGLNHIQDGAQEALTHATAVVPSNGENGRGIEDRLVLWLKADDGVEVENAVECEALGTGCEVRGWRSKVSSVDGPVEFQPVDPRLPPMLQPVAQNGLPVVSLPCGLTHANRPVLHDMMTLFFVISPSKVELGDSYKAQKFFGNSPYGQFLLHGGKPGFYTAGGLVESDFIVANNEFAVLTYRLDRHSVMIKANGLAWSPTKAEDPSFFIRFSGNAALSLGNVKSACDTNAFQGRFAEVLIYDNALSNKRVEEVEKYLLVKWWANKSPTAAVAPESTTTLAAVASSQPSSELDVGLSRATVASSPNEVGITAQVVSVYPPGSTVEPQETSAVEVHDSPEPQQPGFENLPRTFDPEGVFEWVPSAELLAAIATKSDGDSASLGEQWKRTVAEKIATVRNFQLGGEILRSFIRERRDELLTLRDALFGG